MYLDDLGQLEYETVSYIRSETPGLIAGSRGGLVSYEYFMKVFKIFIYLFGGLA